MGRGAPKACECCSIAARIYRWVFTVMYTSTRGELGSFARGGRAPAGSQRSSTTWGRRFSRIERNEMIISVCVGAES